MVNARKEKVIEAIKFIQKSRELKLHKRPEIIEPIKNLALNHAALAEI